MTRTLVVIGHGMVGHRLVEELRARDDADRWRVEVLAEEPRAAYDRVALSSYLDGSSAADLGLAGPGFFADPLVRLHLDHAVTSVDRAARTVRTTGGAEFRYDALVLATGSRPFVPPVPGHDLAGCHVYRTLDDLDGIRDAAVAGAPGVVIGGGLLGLEAANALRLLGMRPHVVERAPRLLPLQVDDGGGRVLARLVEDLGLAVRCGTATASIDAGPDGRVAGVTLGDGDSIAAELVVFSAGVRPRDELAERSGLARADRGGVLVDGRCRTSDEHVWAVGECAAVEGRCYGLVAPGYAMAEVVVRQLLGLDGDAFTGADMSTKLKLLGVDVASFGDAHATADGALEVVHANHAAGTYAKLVLSDDAQVLLGGVLVGDASAYASLRPLVGRALPAPPERLLLPAGPAPDAGALPDDAVVCSCNNVSKGDITAAIGGSGLSDVAGIKACTRAGTSCGSCVPMLGRLLADCGVAPSRALCEHFAHSRAELFEIVRATGIATFSELVRAHGRGRGCDVCKPVVASILASLGRGHVLDAEHAGLQDTNDRFLANLQRNGTYSVVPRVPGGEISADGLIVLGEVAREFGLYTKITGGQRIDLFGARVEQLPAIWRRLVDAGFESGHAYGKALRTVKSCVGTDWCRYGVQDSVAMAVRLELRYRGLRAPHKLKSGVSGCARECAEARSKDFGVIATDQGWNLHVGGNGGFSPRHAELLAADLDDEQLIRLVDRFLMFYVRTADRLQRTAAWIESLDGGLDHVREVVVEDSLGIAADLEAAMAEHVAGYADEWAGVLADPAKLARFVSFVNAPDAPDPTVGFLPDRDRPGTGPVPLPAPSIRPGSAEVPA
ncbi:MULTISPECIES: nitrite reductase large subunit NirB [unclassified Saccharopolyspora]|uniref:nitrite reductase large subunit NirB n=1 Tax=unclassified Saccharopolyspora TaxID=2646250 RepID=UPI001CD7E7E7|nr:MULTISPECIES: nitrite reductase large subunit NirB [unclassified Saccharopolyspora]MCA1185583.1 nitrite reductase large subunit NirB [Saccharopolyspora sp. 6T]MCA1191560.1 nitrite reductase large subunit NirB [Saccharopolyspora sp. 6V]MCA1226328.1 nitrite reductase large subunit NirB [Saccharopolyspora sp. 6M]MCA1280801.1 nitrite reductase large subunit NirB [Saccharopolyspora sp. 7B]